MKILILGACGYIGSRLTIELQKSTEFNIETLDCLWFGNPGLFLTHEIYYQNLSGKDLAKYDAVILLAGHSNVALSIANPKQTIENNVRGPIDLVNKLSKSQLFIYASSSSVYSGYRAILAREEMPLYPATNIYDYSKAAFDNYLISIQSDNSFFGLRFGTVCGASPNIRSELMINSMVKSAVTRGAVNLANGRVNRPILSIQDLCRAIVSILTANIMQPGIYNLSSFNSTAGEIASVVAAEVEAQINYLPDSPTYDFSISSEKFQNVFGWVPKENPKSITRELVDFFKNDQHFKRGSNVNPIA